MMTTYLDYRIGERYYMGVLGIGDLEAYFRYGRKGQ